MKILSNEDFIKTEDSDAAAMVVSAIKEMSRKPDNLDNFESYLSHHFSEWLRKYANTPEGFAEELMSFATMQI